MVIEPNFKFFIYLFFSFFWTMVLSFITPFPVIIISHSRLLLFHCFPLHSFDWRYLLLVFISFFFWLRNEMRHEIINMTIYHSVVMILTSQITECKIVDLSILMKSSKEREKNENVIRFRLITNIIFPFFFFSIQRPTNFVTPMLFGLILFI